MSKNIQQIFIANPITTNTSTDLMYFGQSPYGTSNDAAMTFANFKLQFSNNVLTTKGDLFTYSTTNTRLPVGTIDGQILQVNSSATTGLKWSTTTYPDTAPINSILYASSANVIGVVTPAANSILATNGSNVPALTQTIPSAVQVTTGSLNTGTGASSTTFWRGDGTWATPGGGGSVNPNNIQSGQYVYGYDTSVTVNQIVVAYTPANAALVDGQSLSVKVNFTNTLTAPTLNVDGLGAIPIRYSNGSNILAGDMTASSIYDFQYNLAGFYWSLLNPNSSFIPQVVPSQIQNNSFVYSVATGTSTAYVANFTPAHTSINDGAAIWIKVSNANTNTTPTLNVDGLGAITIANPNNTAIKVGDMVANGEYYLKFNATFGIWALMNPSTVYSGYLPLSGGTMSGDINMGANDIRNVTSIQDTSGLNALTFTYAASAVNYLGVLNGATNNPPELRTFGSDASVPFNIRTKNGVVTLSDYTNTIPGELRIYNTAGNNYSGLKCTAGASSSLTLELPIVDANGFMVSDGNKHLSFLSTFTDVTPGISILGFSLLSTYIVNVMQIGKLIFVYYKIVGTSNSSSFRINNFPYTFISPFDTYTTYTDGGTVGQGHINLSGTSLIFYNTLTSSSWVTSGSKSASGSFIAQIT